MRARALLVTAAVLVAAAIWLWRHSSAEPEPEPARPTEPPAVAARGPRDEPARPTLPDAAGESPRVESKRTEVRRDEGAGASSEPTFKQETLRAIREAAAPQLLRCIAESFARAPELREQSDLRTPLSAVFTANVTRGQVTVRDARVTVHGFTDPELVRCAEDAYNQTRPIVPATQGDGEAVLESSFEMP